MAGMENLASSVPNPTGGPGGGLGGKSPGPSPAAKEGIQQAVQQALKGKGGSQGPPDASAPGKGGSPEGSGGAQSKPASAGGGGAFGMSPPGATGGGSKVGTGEYDPEKQKQVFMRMMVAQLEHQDPLNPTKGTEFTAQLAQFTGVEQQIRSNEHLDKLAGKREDQQQWNAMSLLGREVVLDRNSLNLGDSPGKQQFRFQVGEPAQVSARVTDSRGNVVKEIDLGKREAGSHQASWDGTNSDGKPVSGGEYTIQAVPARGDGAPYQTRVQTTVQEVNMGDKGVQLGIGQGEKVPFDRVQTVSR